MAIRLVISFCRANRSPASLSNRSAHRCVSVAASISWAFTRTRLPRPPDTPFEYVANPKLAADLLGVDGFFAIGERGIARNHQHTHEPRQIGRQVFGDPVREILLLPVVAKIRKGQDDDR